MAQIEVVNLEKLSATAGYKMPANDPEAVSPDNITHAQLRKSPFGSGQATQGTAVSGENSTFEFSIADNDADELFKLYVSTDGTNYTENKTYGGTNGRNPFSATDISGLVTLTTSQNISGTKTINGNANLVIASGSDITVQTGGDLTLADAPVQTTDATNKAYVDGRTWTSCVFWIDAMSLDNTTVALSYRRIFNSTGYTPTLAYGTNSYGEKGLTVTFNRSSSAFDIQTMPAGIDDGAFATVPGVNFYIDPAVNQASANTSVFLVYIQLYGGSTQVSQTQKGVKLIATTATTSHTYDHKEYSINWDYGNIGNDSTYVTSVNNVTVSVLVGVTEQLRNGRIELRFYD